MKKIAAFLMMCALAVAVSGCATAQANPTGDNGSEPVFEEPETENPDELEPEFSPVSDPINLECDNPLGDREFKSVALRLYGVGELELNENDAATILDIVQNDKRIWQDRSTWQSFDDYKYILTSSTGSFVLTLDSGTEIVVGAHTASGSSTNILSLREVWSDNNTHYDLTNDEYESFVAIYDEACAEIIDEADEAVTPYADLTADQLKKVTRVRHYTESDQSEQVLTDEQVNLVIEALNELEMEPAVADFTPEGMGGGGYEFFVLWFKNGEHYAVGANSSYGDYDSDLYGGLDFDPTDYYPVAYIDGVVYKCNPEFATDMYWNYEEFADYYVKRYQYGRNVADHPFEEMTDDEVTSIHVGLDVDGQWQDRLVPLTIKGEVADVLRSLLITADNKYESVYRTMDESIQRSSQIQIGINENESIDLGLDGERVVINQGDYEEDPEVVAALKDLIDHARNEAEKLLASNGETQTVTLISEDTWNIGKSGEGFHESKRFYSFDLSASLIKHDDGYYPEGYTLETAPIYVEVNAYTVTPEFDYETYATITPRPDDAIVTRVEAEMDAANGEGYDSGYMQMNVRTGDYRTITRQGDSAYDRELLVVSVDWGYVFEFHLVQREDYEISYDAVLALLRETFVSDYIAVD